MNLRLRTALPGALFLAAMLSACGGGGGASASAAGPASYTVGGTVTGLSGSGVLQNNGADTLTVSANGAFTFPTTAVSGATYNISVLTQPSPTKRCLVANGTGTVASANVSNITVNCDANFMGGAVQTGHLNTVTTVSTFAGTAFIDGATDGTGLAAQFNKPMCVTTDGTNLYVADTLNNNIRKIVIATRVVSTLAGSLTGVAGANDGTGTSALFNQPGGITTDGIYLYVADTNNHNIRKIAIATGEVSTLAGASTASIGAADGTGTAASFNYPAGITTDGIHLYVADTYNQTIRKITIASGAVSTLAGSPLTPGSTDATGTAALFQYPFGLTTDGVNLFVADSWNNSIRKIIITSGEVSTLAGSLTGLSGASDATGTAALFFHPRGITTDGINLYVADTENHTLRMIVIASKVVSTLAGTAHFSDILDGTGAAAGFNFPGGLVTDGISLYLTDTNNNTIRKIEAP